MHVRPPAQQSRPAGAGHRQRRPNSDARGKTSVENRVPAKPHSRRNAHGDGYASPTPTCHHSSRNGCLHPYPVGHLGEDRDRLAARWRPGARGQSRQYHCLPDRRTEQPSLRSAGAAGVRLNPTVRTWAALGAEPLPISCHRRETHGHYRRPHVPGLGFQRRGRDRGPRSGQQAYLLRHRRWRSHAAQRLDARGRRRAPSSRRRTYPPACSAARLSRWIAGSRSSGRTITCRRSGDTGERHGLSLRAGHATDHPAGRPGRPLRTPLVAERQYREPSGMGVRGPAHRSRRATASRFMAWDFNDINVSAAYAP